MSRKRWVFFIGFSIAMIGYTFLGRKYMQFQEDVNKSLRESITKLHETQRRNNLGFILRIKKLEDGNKKQQEIIDKMNDAMFGEQEIGENPG
jgi:hypothetical protein